MDYTKLPAVVSLDANKQRGWVAVGEFKAMLEKEHQLKTLELQKLIQAPGTTIVEIETTLANYRKVHTGMVTAGQEWRGFITSKVLQPSLDTEKEYSPKSSEAYLLVEKDLTAKKVAASNAAQQTNAKNQELANYAAHVKNEFLNVVAEFKQAAIKEINQNYIDSLKGKVKHPDTDAIKAVIKEMKPRAYVLFTKHYMTDENKAEYVAVGKSIPHPDFNKIREELITEVDNRFASYQHDLAANTVEQVEQEAKQEIEELGRDAQIETGVNQMAAQSTVAEIQPEGKRLKKAVEVVLEGSKTWAMHVSMEFWKNALISDYVTVKQWENLSVKQMAGAVGKWASATGEMSPNLQYREVVK